MARGIFKILIIILSLISAGYMAFDGFTALKTGDYIRPASGEHMGELGPWATLADLIGIDPMSTLMKSVFLGLGLFGLLSVGVFLVKGRLGSALLVAFCILTLWNLFLGTVISFVCLLLLIAYRRLNRVSSLSIPIHK